MRSASWAARVMAVPMLWNLNYPRETEMGAFAVVGRPAFDALARHDRPLGYWQPTNRTESYGNSW